MTHESGYCLHSMNVLFFPIPVHLCRDLFKIALCHLTVYISVSAMLGFFLAVPLSVLHHYTVGALELTLFA